MRGQPMPGGPMMMPSHPGAYMPGPMGPPGPMMFGPMMHAPGNIGQQQMMPPPNQPGSMVPGAPMSPTSSQMNIAVPPAQNQSMAAMPMQMPMMMPMPQQSNASAVCTSTGCTSATTTTASSSCTSTWSSTSSSRRPNC